MGIKQLYNDNLRKLPNEYGDVSVMKLADNEDRHKISHGFEFGPGRTFHYKVISP